MNEDLPRVVASDSLEPDDGDLFDTPTIYVDANRQIDVRWPKETPPQYVQMSEPLFTEWVVMMNALRRLIDLLLTVSALEHRQRIDGKPSHIPRRILHEIDRLKETLRIP